MKWINGKTRAQKEKELDRKMGWNKWFAWYPVKVGTIKVNGIERRRMAWLCYVKRKGTIWVGGFTGIIYCDWKYKEVE